MSRVALVQMVSSANVQENLFSLDHFFSKARDEDAKLLVLPENFAFMGMKQPDKLLIAEPYGHGEAQLMVSQLAKQYAIWVIAGTIFLQCSAKRVYAACLVYDDKGGCVARYDKIHLFDACVSGQEEHQESATIQRGEGLVVVDTPVGCVGLSVCYDLRFPELYRQLALKGAKIFTVPSAFTSVTGAAHWEVLLRARAIENLCYVVASNQGGEHTSGRKTHGHSMIVEPWGKILCEQQKGPGVIVADIDLQHLRQLRRQLPCNDHHVLNV